MSDSGNILDKFKFNFEFKFGQGLGRVWAIKPLGAFDEFRRYHAQLIQLGPQKCTFWKNTF